MKTIDLNTSKINLAKCETFTCKCGGILWLQGIVLKKISGIMLGDGSKTGITQVGILFCSDCRSIHPDHLLQIQPPISEVN